MKSVEAIDNPNCVPIPASCVTWNYGSIDYLGICNGDKLPTIIYEIVNKLQDIAGEDLNDFDVDGLLEICKLKAPKQQTLISILTLLRDNQICLKDYIVNLEQQIVDLSNEQNVNVSLKCLADFDQFGNQLGITRETLDQLVIDKLCNHETRITTVEGKITLLQNEIANTEITILEPSITTCVDPASKSTSLQVQSVATKVCSIETYLGNSTDAQYARGNYDFSDSDYSLISGWILNSNRLNILDDYNNLLLVTKNLESRLIEIETNCCAPTCDKIKIGFSVVVDDAEAGDYMVRFRPTDGTSLFGFVSTGSQISFTGTLLTDGTTATAGLFPVDINETNWDDNVYNLSQFDLSKPITVNISPIMIKDSLSCQKCVSQVISLNMGCAVCQLTASGEKGDSGKITIVYQYE